MNEIVIEIVSGKSPYYAQNMDFDVLTFRTAEHAMKYLKQVLGFSEDEIKALNVTFVYTNESKECKCHLCEKRGDCYIRDKFQRLPAEITNGLGLGLCPKLGKKG